MNRHIRFNRGVQANTPVYSHSQRESIKTWSALSNLCCSIFPHVMGVPKSNHEVSVSNVTGDLKEDEYERG
jgi:hypothetical protein